jgi:hypothetical protein
MEYFPATAFTGEHRSSVSKNLEDPPQEHHVLAKEHLAELLHSLMGEEQSLLPKFPSRWTVYVHRSCHNRGKTVADMQDSATAATARLKLMQSPPFATSNEAELSRLEGEARAAHESGFYGISVFQKEILRSSLLRMGEVDASLRVLEFGLASLAGVRGTEPVDLNTFASGLARDRPLAVLHTANHASNVANAKAQQYLDHGRDLLDGPARQQRDELALDLMLRTAQVERTAVAADQAIGEAITRGSVYRVDTARVIAAMIALSEGRSVAQHHLEALISQDRNVSWLYRAESWLGKAVLSIQQRKPRDAYRLIVASQYVYILLGLQGTPHPALPVAAGNRADCMPADLLRDPQFEAINRDERLELRQMAIIESSLRRDLALHLASGVPPRFCPDPLSVKERGPSTSGLEQGSVEL